MEGIQFEENYYPVPAAAQDADPTAEMRDLFYRLSKADSSLQECEMQRQGDVKEVLVEVIETSDHVVDAVEQADVPNTPKETSLINDLIAFGKALRDLLDRHQVEAITTIGMPVDSETAQVVGYEPQAQVPPGTVLREQRVGYRWPGGILRRAQVVVAGSSPPPAPEPVAPQPGPAPVS